MKNTFASLSLILILSLFTASCTKTNNGPAAVAGFSFTVNGLKATFSNSSTNAANYSWDFGDGTATSIATSPSHTYTNPGTYTVILTASGNGSSSNASQTVTVTGTVVNPNTGLVAFWLTNTNQSQLLEEQGTGLTFNAASNSNITITVDTTQTYQDIDGFGFTLTGGSATAINGLGATQKAALLTELFGTGTGSIGISYLRLSIGSSDLNQLPFSYDDIPSGQTDQALSYFTLTADEAGGTGLIPLLQQILAINPNIKILAAPWSAPVWMKTSGSFSGGSLNTAYYNVYAQYFVKYIQQMKAAGITIDAITPQNEPRNSNNNPAMTLSAQQEINFIANDLGPALQSAGLSTKIIAYDHNCDDIQYPDSVLTDATAYGFVNGTAFHLYAGGIGALTTMHNFFPDKAVYFTEYYEAAGSTLADDLEWYEENIIIGSMNNWSRVALLWNLASDASFEPHTSGGCSDCMGALTISGSTITRNPGYYIVGQASKFVPAGSIRVTSSSQPNLPNVAFMTPSGGKVLIVTNSNKSTTETFNIGFKEKIVTATLQPGSVGTFVWQ